VCLCEAVKNLNASIRGIFIITKKLGLFLQNVFGWGTSGGGHVGTYSHLGLGILSP
jgi:hypothetical protein